MATNSKPATSKPATSKPATDKSATDKPATPKAPALDFGSLTIAKADAPVRSGAGRPKTWAPHPALVEALQGSWDARKVLNEGNGTRPTTFIGEGRQIVVAESQHKTLVSAIRRVADHLGMGVAVDVDVVNGDATVRFAAKSRKRYLNNAK